MVCSDVLYFIIGYHKCSGECHSLKLHLAFIKISLFKVLSQKEGTKEFSGLVCLQLYMNTTVKFSDTLWREIWFLHRPVLAATTEHPCSIGKQPDSVTATDRTSCLFLLLPSQLLSQHHPPPVEEAVMGCRVLQHSTPKLMPTRAVVLLTGQPEHRHHPVDCGKAVDAWSSALTDGEEVGERRFRTRLVGPT